MAEEETNVSAGAEVKRTRLGGALGMPAVAAALQYRLPPAARWPGMKPTGPEWRNWQTQGT